MTSLLVPAPPISRSQCGLLPQDEGKTGIHTRWSHEGTAPNMFQVNGYAHVVIAGILNRKADPHPPTHRRQWTEEAGAALYTSKDWVRGFAWYAIDPLNIKVSFRSSLILKSRCGCECGLMWLSVCQRNRKAAEDSHWGTQEISMET